MSEVIVFVDDLFPRDPHYVTQDICDEIHRMSQRAERDIKTIVIHGEDLQGTPIAEALDVIENAIDQQFDATEDVLIGICIDLVDRRTVDRPAGLFDGELLLERIKENADLRHLDVIVYTGKFVEVDEQRLKSKGAKGIVRKAVVRGSERTYQIMATDILRMLP